MKVHEKDAQSALKAQVRAFWDAGSCGEIYAEGASAQEYYDAQRRTRYALEPYLPGFARFEDARGKDILEIGVGMGADHRCWAEQTPASLTGFDLTPRAIRHTRHALVVADLQSRLLVADAERMPFENECFDLVYSWGVLHHSPDTAQAVREVWRVLRPGGSARIMIYHARSLTGYMLWTRYALLRGKPWRPMRDIFARHLESPGTQAFTVAEARALFARFRSVRIRTQLNFGDLLQGEAGQRHRGILLSIARRLAPRALMRILLKRFGLLLLIEAER